MRIPFNPLESNRKREKVAIIIVTIKVGTTRKTPSIIKAQKRLSGEARTCCDRCGETSSVDRVNKRLFKVETFCLCSVYYFFSLTMHPLSLILQDC